MKSIHNRQERAFIIPGWETGSRSIPHITIDPGTSALIEDEHWAHVSKGNRVIEALMEGRHLLVTGENESVPLMLADAGLRNPAGPSAPDELTAPLVDSQGREVAPESSLQVTEVTLDEPAEAPAPSRSSRKA